MPAQENHVAYFSTDLNVHSALMCIIFSCPEVTRRLAALQAAALLLADAHSKCNHCGIE